MDEEKPKYKSVTFRVSWTPTDNEYDLAIDRCECVCEMITISLFKQLAILSNPQVMETVKAAFDLIKKAQRDLSQLHQKSDSNNRNH